jgi:hypothetical protein
MSTPERVVIHERPEWPDPLFAELRRRGVAFDVFDLKSAHLSDLDEPRARLCFNQASPSASVRGNTRAVPLNIALLRHLRARGAEVINGAEVFALELSKSAQHSLLRSLGIDCPRSIVFDDPRSLRGLEGFPFRALIKPDQGGSGARISVVESVEDIEAILARDLALWFPDGLYLLQELCAHDPERGIEYLEAPDGRRVFYDIDANSNLRPSIAQAFGFEPFERVVDHLVARIAALNRAVPPGRATAQRQSQYPLVVLNPQLFSVPQLSG